MKTKLVILLAIFGMVLGGCDDDEFLNRNPTDFLAPDNFQTERDIKEAVNGIYTAYISNNMEPLFTEFIVDNGYYVGYKDMWNLVFNSETPEVETKWSRNYQMILRANTVLHFIDNVDLTEDQYNQYKGEATFLRALAYFDLTEFYGDVPFRLKPESLAEADKAITPKDSIVDFVLDELEIASELLPETYGSADRGRATKGAALAIKARVLLYNQQYEEAVAYCQKVKDLGIYSLTDEYQLLFLPEGEGNNPEVIFDMQFVKDGREQGVSNGWYTYFVRWSGFEVLKNLEEQYYSTNGLSINDPNNELYDESVNPQIYSPSAYILDGGYDNRFSNRDPRMYYTLVVPYSIHDYNKNTFAPQVYYPKSKSNANFTSFRAKKYVDYSDHYVNLVSGVNPIIIRYADILLIEAEALVESGDYDEPYVASLVNEVRQRPGVMMPKVEDVEGTGLSQDELRQIVRHERRVEFALEGLRIFDIKRWDIGQEAYSDGIGYNPSKLTASSAVYERYVYQERSFDPAKGYLWPIPKSETDANKLIVNGDN